MKFVARITFKYPASPIFYLICFGLQKLFIAHNFTSKKTIRLSLLPDIGGQNLLFRKIYIKNRLHDPPSKSL